MTYKERYQELLGQYKDMERTILEAQANKKTAQAQKRVLEGKIKTLLKLKMFSAEETEKILQKIEKEIETQLSVLSERIQEYEQKLNEFKTGEVIEKSSDDMNHILEEL